MAIKIFPTLALLLTTSGAAASEQLEPVGEKYPRLAGGKAQTHRF
jgi:hypothetical protein